MSRHTLKPIKPEHVDHEIVVGWDSTLGNFFGEVRRPRDNGSDLGGELVISIAQLRATRSFDNLNKEFNEVFIAISDYAFIDNDLRAKLWEDSKKEGINFRG